MKKYVIYTIMAGKYGEIRQPLHIDNRFDYVLFSNEFKERYIGVWQVRPIPIPPEIEATDNKRLSRYPKAHPETMLAEYDASLYIDANIQILDQWVYDRIIELSQKGIEYAGVKLLLTNRDCIYRHSYDMCLRNLVHDYDAIQQMHELKKNNFPEHYGLNENNVIFRRHSTKMKEVDDLWWQQIVKYTFRDQFSYMFCLWKYKIPIIYFIPEQIDARSSEHFIVVNHEALAEIRKKKFLKLGIFEAMRNKYRTISSWHYKHYCESWVRMCEKNNPILWLNISGIINSIIWFPLILWSQLKKLLSLC